MSSHLHPLRPGGRVIPTRGDFGAIADCDDVIVPTVVFDVCRRLNIRSVEALINLAHSLPSAIAGELGWTTQEVQQAASSAARDLPEVSDLQYLLRTERPAFAFGAFPPRPVEERRSDAGAS